MKKGLNRRNFLKSLGAGAVASSALLTACKGKDAAGSAAGNYQEPPRGKMTYRTNPTTKDRVSILGYGMMRLPVKGGGTGRENPDAEIDQEMVNRQVDYALEHGVNYFDTSPAYCQGRSEAATGIALSRHKRSEYYIATKLSNFAPETWPAAASREMFENSLRELKTDYVDYLLLHAIGWAITAWATSTAAISTTAYSTGSSSRSARGAYATSDSPTMVTSRCLTSR